MGRRLLLFWYVILSLLTVELLSYGLTGYVADRYRMMVWNHFNKSVHIFHDVDKSIPYGDIINVRARGIGINPQIIASVIEAESSFRPYAVSPAGAYGLMQIMPSTWRQINEEYKICVGRHKGECTSECYFNVDLNIHIGTIYLSQLVKKYQGNMVLALAAYNAGPGAVDHYGGMPPYADTINYTEHIIKNWYTVENEKIFYVGSLIGKRWTVVHQVIGWCLIMTAFVMVWTIRRLITCQSSWYWR